MVAFAHMQALRNTCAEKHLDMDCVGGEFTISNGQIEMEITEKSAASGWMVDFKNEKHKVVL